MKISSRLRITLAVVTIAILLPMVSSARFISIDPNANKYPSVSPYVYTFNNPLKFIDPDGKDVAFNVYQTERTKQFGHLDMYFQDGDGNWIKFNQGDYGVKLSPSEGPPKGSLLLRTTPEQDALIAKSALRSKADHDSGKLKYDECTYNCKDAPCDVINNSGSGVEVDNPSLTITPLGWFQDQKKATTETVVQQPGGQPADNTRVIIVMPKFEIW